MAVYKIFPISDATIYSGYPAMNTGLDPLTEINSEYPLTLSPSPRVARTLIRFDQSEIEDVIDNKISGSNWSGSLKSSIAVAEGLTQTSKLYVFPISGSWNNGTGQYLDSPQTTNGVSWVFTNESGSLKWKVDDDRPFTTSSYTSGNSGGGTWLTGSNLSAIGS